MVTTTDASSSSSIPTTRSLFSPSELQALDGFLASFQATAPDTLSASPSTLHRTLSPSSGSTDYYGSHESVALRDTKRLREQAEELSAWLAGRGVITGSNTQYNGGEEGRTPRQGQLSLRPVSTWNSAAYPPRQSISPSAGQPSSGEASNAISPRNGAMAVKSEEADEQAMGPPAKKQKKQSEGTHPHMQEKGAYEPNGQSAPSHTARHVASVPVQRQHPAGSSSQTYPRLQPLPQSQVPALNASSSLSKSSSSHTPASVSQSLPSAEDAASAAAAAAIAAGPLTDAQKRLNHIASEQKRRTAIRSAYDQLCEVVPSLRAAVKEYEDRLSKIHGSSTSASSSGMANGESSAGHAAEEVSGEVGEEEGGGGARRKSATQAELEQNQQSLAGVLTGGIEVGGEKVDGRAGPKSEAIVLAKTVEYLRQLLSDRESMLARLAAAWQQGQERGVPPDRLISRDEAFVEGRSAWKVIWGKA